VPISAAGTTLQGYSVEDLIGLGFEPHTSNRGRRLTTQILKIPKFKVKFLNLWYLDFNFQPKLPVNKCKNGNKVKLHTNYYFLFTVKHEFERKR